MPGTKNSMNRCYLCIALVTHVSFITGGIMTHSKSLYPHFTHRLVGALKYADMLKK